MNKKNASSKEELLSKLEKLKMMYKNGQIGGEVMPEDQNPLLEKGSAENYIYFTLPMALNYQRNSYTLWDSAKRTFDDKKTQRVFNPYEVDKMDQEELKELLTTYKVALQPNKQTDVWKRLCATIVDHFDGDIRNLFINTNGNIPDILKFIQVEHKKEFPYLSGNKICNYWLYVMGQYTDVKLVGRDALNIAPDTHVLQASAKLGLIEEAYVGTDIQEYVSMCWRELLSGTGINPIDIHKYLWLWSRNGFKKIE